MLKNWNILTNRNFFTQRNSKHKCCNRNWRILSAFHLESNAVWIFHWNVPGIYLRTFCWQLRKSTPRITNIAERLKIRHCIKWRSIWIFIWFSKESGTLYCFLWAFFWISLTSPASEPRAMYLLEGETSTELSLSG